MTLQELLKLSSLALTKVELVRDNDDPMTDSVEATFESNDLNGILLVTVSLDPTVAKTIDLTLHDGRAPDLETIVPAERTA